MATAYAAQLGTMKVTEQIDAMRVLGSSPIRKLVLPRILAFCLCSVAGQYFIFLTIKNFGPLTVSIITTCRYVSNFKRIEVKLIFRKFFSVLFSVFIFGNVLTAQQWVGAIIVFSGLVVDIYFGEH